MFIKWRKSTIPLLAIKNYNLFCSIPQSLSNFLLVPSLSLWMFLLCFFLRRNSILSANACIWLQNLCLALCLYNISQLITVISRIIPSSTSFISMLSFHKKIIIDSRQLLERLWYLWLPFALHWTCGWFVRFQEQLLLHL